MNLTDRVGCRYGSLVIKERLPQKVNGRIAYRAECDCGNSVDIWSFANDHDRMKKNCGCSKKSRKDPGESNFNSLFRSYQRNAKKRNLRFELSIDKFRELVTSNCSYCDSTPSNIKDNGGKRNGTFLYNGIDRIDPKEGYVESNVTPCCSRCNTAKMCMSKEDFLNWILAVYDRLFYDIGKDVN